MPAFVTLTTDFEEREPDVASAKGVLCTQCPGVSIIDLSHQIPRHNVREAALFIAGAVPYFPAGTVHIVAVASGATPIAVRVNGQIVICPDNGLITMLAAQCRIEEARSITGPEPLRSDDGQTYYCRDVFAPVAARLAGGAPFESLGGPIEKVKVLELPLPKRANERKVAGEILHVNRFGSLVTNIHRSFLEGSRVMNVEVAGVKLGPLSASYTEVDLGCPVILYGSSGYLEIAYNGDRADRRLDVGEGIRVGVTTEPEGAT